MGEYNLFTSLNPPSPLQKVIKEDDVYEVEEILDYKKRHIGKKVITHIKMRWKENPPSFENA